MEHEDSISLAEMIDIYDRTHACDLVSPSHLAEELVRDGVTRYIGHKRAEAIVATLQADIRKQYGKQVLLVTFQREYALYIVAVSSLPSEIND